MGNIRKGRITSDGTAKGTKVVLGDGTEMSNSNRKSITIRIEPGIVMATIEVVAFLPNLDIESAIVEKMTDG